MAPENRPPQKEVSSSNHSFLGDMLVSGRVTQPMNKKNGLDGKFSSLKGHYIDICIPLDNPPSFADNSQDKWRGVLKWWVSPTTTGLSYLKIIILGCEMGIYHHLRKHPYSGYQSMDVITNQPRVDTYSE